MRVQIEQDHCVASGQCVMLAPAVFDQDDDGIVVLLNERPDQADHEVVREAEQVCPASAIFLDH
jgi:ferredoxin